MQGQLSLDFAFHNLWPLPIYTNTDSRVLAQSRALAVVLISRLGDNQAHAGDHKVTAPSILTGQGYKENMGQRVGGQNMAQQKGYSVPFTKGERWSHIIQSNEFV